LAAHAGTVEEAGVVMKTYWTYEVTSIEGEKGT
jgi:hypothetical protein